MKNIIKFILRLVVAGAVVGGIVFAIIHFTAKDNKTNIIDKSYNAEIVAKYQASYDGLSNYATANSNNAKLLSATNSINEVLIEYYNHYITLTAFSKNVANSEDILTKMDNLVIKINYTTNLLNLTKSELIGDNPTERQQRFNNTLGALIEQTKLLFEIDDMLQQYVFENVYGTTYSGVTYEAQLEMVKDFSRYVFDAEIEGHLNAENIGTALTYAGENGFFKVLTKFKDRQTVDKNSSYETKFVDRYFDITEDILNGYYQTTTDASQYVAGIEDETMKNNVDALYNYLMQTSF